MSGRCARLRRAAVRWNSRGNSSEDRRPGGTSRAWSISSNDGSIATLNAVHSGLAMTTIAMLGSPEQRAQYLPRMATCEVLGAFALTEPNHGSDVVALETRARRDGNEWVLDGQKRWIGNGTVAAIVVVWARDDENQVGAFVVEHPDGPEHPATTPGRSSARPRTAECGRLRSAWTASGSPRAPASPRHGPGTTPTMCWPNPGKPSPGKRSATPWPPTKPPSPNSMRRQEFGRPLARFQLIQDKPAHMLSDITGMQLMCTRMSQLQAEGRVSIEHAAIAKLNTGDGARRVCAMARDILGGNGILLDHHVARHHADIEAVYTYEGTDSIQSLIVGRAITGLNAFR